MTEERKKYLASISVEERAVRLAIKEYQSKIKNLKLNLTEWGDTFREDFVLLHRNHIALYKKTVKALKKQLPAPLILKRNSWLHQEWFECPACHNVINFESKYCDDCGQKLK